MTASKDKELRIVLYLTRDEARKLDKMIIREPIDAGQQKWTRAYVMALCVEGNRPRGKMHRAAERVFEDRPVNGSALCTGLNVAVRYDTTEDPTKVTCARCVHRLHPEEYELWLNALPKER
jgi:hypothetical protein